MGILPTQKSKPKSRISDFNILVYGPPKIGKTQLGSEFPDPVFIATEPGHGAIEAHVAKCYTFERLNQALNELKIGKHPFKTVVIDTATEAFSICRQKALEDLEVEDESDPKAAYGKGFKRVANTFRVLMKGFLDLRLSVLILAHPIVQTIETNVGKMEKTTLDIVPKPRVWLLGHMDMVFYLDIHKNKERVFKTKQSPYYDAGDRTGKLPEMIPYPIGSNGYEILEKAFQKNNETKGNEL